MLLVYLVPLMQVMYKDTVLHNFVMHGHGDNSCQDFWVVMKCNVAVEYVLEGLAASIILHFGGEIRGSKVF
jgi:hypothetical protein